MQGANFFTSGCPICGGQEGFELAYTNVVCSGCRALLNLTPFGVKLIMKDENATKVTAKRFPEILNWWDRRNDLTEEEIKELGF